MRLCELQLLAFGPFTDASLQFESPPASEAQAGAPSSGMHVIYGPNEAGKSTALRAITALLYGIPSRTGDAHVHAMKKLRVGGVLEFGGGERLRIVRRKGLKRTLLDVDDKPIDEARLSRALCGVGRSLFVTMFGLDHVTLREGAQALLRGDGDVGESLFDAGGARGIGAVLEGLREEAEALYKARGQTPRLNDALRRFTEAKNSVLLKEMLPSAWTAQKQATEQARVEHEALTADRQRLGAERSRLQRALRAFPHLTRRSEIRQRMQTLGNVPRLASDARERRLSAQQEREVCTRRSLQLREEIAGLRQERDGLVVDEALAELDEAVLADVNDRRGNHLKAKVDLPKREARWSVLGKEAEELLVELGGDTTLEQARGRRLDKPARTRLDALRNAYGRRAAELESATLTRDETRAKRAAVAARIQSFPAETDVGALKRAVARATRDGDLQSQVASAERARATLAERVAVLRTAFGGTGREPSREAVDGLGARMAAHVAEADALAADDTRLRTRRDEVLTDLSELAQLGAPSTAELALARSLRDELWETLARDLGQATASQISAYADATTEADRVADRLWQQADRAAKHARLTAESQAIDRQMAKHEASTVRLVDERRATDEAWRALWTDLPEGVEVPANVSEGVARLQEHEELLGVVAELAAADDAMATDQARLTEHRERFISWVGDEGDLRDMLDRAESLIERQEERRHQRHALSQKIEELDEELAVLNRRVELKQEALREWKSEWRDAVHTLGLGEDATVGEVAAVENVLSDLFARLRDADDLARRIEGMRRDEAQFRDIVVPLVQRHAVSLIDEPIDRAAEGLLRLYRQSRVNRQRRGELADKTAANTAQLAAVLARSADAEQTLAELMRMANAGEEAELEAIEKRAELSQQLERGLQETETALFTEGSIEELEALTRDLDVDETRARVSDLEEEYRDVIERSDRVSATIGANERGLQELEQKEGAVGAAAAREATLSSIRRHAARYCRVRLAALLLEREIERYRQHHQGPILARAGELFPRLTLGRYTSLSVGFDDKDEPALRCQRADGSEIAVSGLSDGTRDQLYLALRLASLERYAQRSELLPFVVDDVLIHFDDERARAALEVLVEFAAQTQVLFFTHHQRLVELAEGLGEQRVRHHRLPDPIR